MTDEERKLMGSRIRTSRKNAGLSQDELAEKLGMKRPNVAGYEAGRVIPPGNVLKVLAEVLHTSTDYLLGNEAATIYDQEAKKDEVQFDDETRALARKLQNLNPKNKKVLAKLIDTMSDMDDEEDDFGK